LCALLKDVDAVSIAWSLGADVLRLAFLAICLP